MIKHFDPMVIKAMFGDSLKGVWFPSERDSGGDVIDLSGNGHTGTPTDVSFDQRPLASGLVGSSAGFNGSSSNIELAQDASPFVGQDFSLLAWHTPGEGAIFNSGGRATGTGDWGGWGLRSVDNTYKVTSHGIMSEKAYFKGRTRKPTLVAVRHRDSDERWQVRDPDTGWTEASLMNGRRVAESGLLSLIGSSRKSDGDLENFFSGVIGMVAVVTRQITDREFDQLVDLSGIRNPPAYYQPGYVSEYPTSPRRYYAEYVSDYLDAIGKPAVEVWPKRRYGAATAGGVKGAHDGSLGANATAAAPLEDDYGQSIAETAGQAAITVPSSTDFHSDTTFTFLAIAASSEGSYWGPISKNSAGAGWIGRCVTGGTQYQVVISEAGGDAVSPPLVVGVNDGIPHLFAGGLASDQRAFSSVDGAPRQFSVSPLASFDTINTEDLIIGDSLIGSTSFAAFTPYELTDAELDHLHEAAFDRTKRLTKAQLAAL